MKLQGRRGPSVRFVPTRNARLLGDGHLAVPLDLLSLPSGVFREPLTCAVSVETLSCRLLAFYLIFSTFFFQPGHSTLCKHSCDPPLLRFTGVSSVVFLVRVYSQSAEALSRLSGCQPCQSRFDFVVSHYRAALLRVQSRELIASHIRP